MAKKFLYAALAGVSLLFAGCNEDLVGDYVQPTEKHFGEEIMFGGSASYNVNDNGGTRTIYGGHENITDGAEPVYWIQGDKVRLYCPEAAVKTADYSVTATATDATDEVKETGLSKIGDAGLQWGVPTASHTFYGVYPIPADNSLKSGVTVTGKIPAVQEYKRKITDGSGNIVLMPNMDYAYMVAKTLVVDPNDIGDNVFMKFSPIATAVEIELKNDANNTDYDIREVHLTSSTHNLCGSFTASLDNMPMPADGNVRYATGCPTEISYGTDADKTVGVRLTSGTETTVLKPGNSVTFTIFMLPSTLGATDTDVIDNLGITLIAANGSKTGTFEGISIKKSKKNFIHQMPLGGELTYNQSEWLKFVEDEKALNELSIPGAGGAASGNVYAKNTSLQDYYEQTISIQDLWKQGIRCFEFTVDIASTDSELGAVNVYCNAQDCEMNLATAVKNVKDQLIKHPEEFAMVIITYQQQSGWNTRNETTGIVSQTRNPAKFMEQLNTFWNLVTAGTHTTVGDWKDADGNVKTGTALYDHSATVKDARGKLFCIARPTSNGEDNYAQVNGNEGDGNPLETTEYPTSIETPNVTEPNILVIHGWGALKDKWYARGFTDCVYKRGVGNSAFNAAIEKGQQANLGYNTINSERPGRPFDVSSCGNDAFSTLPSATNGYADSTSQLPLEVNFYYSTIAQKDANVLQTQAAWVQEWARVAKSSTIFEIEKESWHLSKDLHGADGVYIKWISSLQEKKNHISDCLNYAISKEINGEKVSNVFFINSLCGYYINATSDNPESAYPNSLTDCNAAYTLAGNRGDLKFNKLTAASSRAGMCGDIASFASDINSYFLTCLKEKLQESNRLAGSTGIVLMDRVSASGAGAEIPSIIIANNFSSDYEATDPTAPTSVVADGDTPLSREGVNIVWGEWE